MPRNHKVRRSIDFGIGIISALAAAIIAQLHRCIGAAVSTPSSPLRCSRINEQGDKQPVDYNCCNVVQAAYRAQSQRRSDGQSNSAEMLKRTNRLCSPSNRPFSFIQQAASGERS